MSAEFKRAATAALAGRRVDATDAKTVRFPENNIARVKNDILRIFKDNHITGVVCAAACGADLIALEIARDLHLKRTIVLPFNIVTFRSQSVVDRPGNWGEIYDSIIEEAQTNNELIVLNLSSKNQTAYEATNQVILDQAVCMSEKQAAALYETRSLKAVVVWEGQSRGNDDITAAFAQEAQRRDFEMLEVITI